MNIEILKSKLYKTEIPCDSYELHGGLPNERFCISKNGTDWEVYYSERGSKSGLRVFSTESTACEYFYEMMLKTFSRY